MGWIGDVRASPSRHGYQLGSQTLHLSVPVLEAGYEGTIPCDFRAMV